MKKSSKYTIIIIIILIIIIAPAANYLYNKSKETKKIQEINQAQFNLFKCISNCSIIHSGNNSAFKQDCLSECNNLTKPTKEYPEKQLIKDYQYIACTRKINMTDSMSLEKYQTCLTDLIPILKNKYNYLN